MFARYGAIFVLGAVIFDPLATSAQTSSATVVSDVQNSEATPPAPARPLIVPDTYYPVQSLLSSEEGHVALKVNVGKDGKVSSVERVMPSGSARLDQVAMLLARTQWQFKPAMKDGQATEGAVNVDVAWKLPLRPADDLLSDIMGFSTAGKSVVEPKAIPGAFHFTPGDYPYAAIQRGEQGEVALRVAVGEDGTVADVQLLDSSGSPRLDEGASTLVKQRFRYEPGTVDGKPTSIPITIMFKFVMSNSKTAQNVMFCHSRPILGESMSMVSDGSQGNLKVDEWLHVTANAIDDVVLRTDNGWRHFSTPLIQATSAALAKSLAPSVVRGAPFTGSLIGGRPPARPASCWYRAEVAPVAK